VAANAVVFGCSDLLMLARIMAVSFRTSFCIMLRLTMMFAIYESSDL
jgi:hypothetical protein